jgi:hypothetical protein
MTTTQPSLHSIPDGLFIGVIGLNSGSVFPTEESGRKVDDICCVDLRQKGPNLWKLFSTHASARIDDGEISICRGSVPPQDGLISYRLKRRRDTLLTALTKTEKKGGFPYISVQGRKIVLFGDFSGLPGLCLFALKKIFFANGAREVEFVKTEIPPA